MDDSTTHAPISHQLVKGQKPVTTANIIMTALASASDTARPILMGVFGITAVGILAAFLILRHIQHRIDRLINK